MVLERAADGAAMLRGEIEELRQEVDEMRSRVGAVLIMLRDLLDRRPTV